MNEKAHPFPLETRESLPDALRMLAVQFPRDDWAGHQNFDGLVRFWLERHIMFRRLLAMMQEDLTQLDGKQIEESVFQQRLARLGSMFVGELHMHHTIEDTQYFPVLQKMESALARGFEILDHDHHALDEHLAGFTETANDILKSKSGMTLEAARPLHTTLEAMERFLNRHLVDEEELVVPVILKHGFDVG